MRKYVLRFDRNRRFEYAVDLNDFYEKYSVKKVYKEYDEQTMANGYKMLIGTPTLVNIEGTYVDINNLANIYKGPAQLLFNYISGVKTHENINELWELRWV